MKRNCFIHQGNGDVRQVLASIYSIQVAKKLVPIEAESLDFTIKGYVTLPEVTRASRNYMSTIVNGRYVRNFVLMKAIQQGIPYIIASRTISNRLLID